MSKDSVDIDLVKIKINRKKAVKVASLSASNLIDVIDQTSIEWDSLQGSFPKILENEDPEYRYFLDAGLKALNKALACVKVFKILIEK